MIRIIETKKKIKARAQGWIQDAADFTNLKRLVSAFDRNSIYFNEIIDKINSLVSDEDGKSTFLEKLYKHPIILKYRDIVGKSFKPRSTSRCNGIGQAALKGQDRDFQIDWPTDNFLRWAVALQLINHDIINDTYVITKVGETYAKSNNYTTDKQIIMDQFMYYSPVKRILELLMSGEKSKFTLGQQLGFIGEKGFTSVSEDVFIKRYSITDIPDRKKLKTDYEGSSDKYARQICSWLKKLGLVQVIKKSVLPDNGTLNYYRITNQGKDYLNRIKSNNTFYVPFGMLSMESKNRDLHRKRRALLLMFASDKSNNYTISNIVDLLRSYEIDTSEDEIKDDIQSLYSCGLDIYVNNVGIICLDCKIIGLDIPSQVDIEPFDEAELIKKDLRSKLHNVDHRYLSIIDFSYNLGKGNYKMFEYYTASIYNLISKKTQLLGGPRKPDVVTIIDDLGIIIDTKAYKSGFNISQQEEDKIVRYLDEADKKDPNINSTKWWIHLENCTEVVFQFVSSSFGEKALDKLEQIRLRTNKNGVLMTAKSLLLIAENYLSTNTLVVNIFKSNNII